MSRPPRIDRKSLKRPDEFVEKGQHALRLLLKQRARFMPILLVAGIVVLAVYGYDWWSSGRIENAWKGYNDAQSLAETTRFEQLKSVYAKYPQMRPGYFAALGVADHFFEEAKKESAKTGGGNPSTGGTAAVEWYGKALEYRSLGPTEKQLVLIDRGAAYEVQRKWDDAVADYRRAADLPGDAKVYALLGIGRIFELKGEVAKAVETFEKIAADKPNSEYARLAKNSIRLLKSSLFATSDKKDL